MLYTNLNVVTYVMLLKVYFVLFKMLDIILKTHCI